MINFFALAQDKIYLTDNSVIQAKVIEINSTDVKYKKADNLSGPDYVLPKTQVAMIIYENGTHEVLNTVKSDENMEVDLAYPPFYQTKKNLICVNYFDLIFKNVTLSYTRYLLDYHLSIGLSASAGFTNNENQYSYSGNSFLYFDKDYGHGILSVNYFPGGMNKVSYNTGLSLMMGYGGDYYYGGYPYNEPLTLVNKTYYGFYVNNSVHFNITKHFNVRSSLALGLVDRDMNGEFETHAMFEISAGIRF